jgi:hypothetical protein
VARAYRDCADGVRKQELKCLKRELPKAEYDLLKGLIKAFRKQADQLKDEDWVVLRWFFDNAPKAEQAYSLREELTDFLREHIPRLEPSVRFRLGVNE